MNDPLAKIMDNGLSFVYGSYSALDKYFNIKEPGTVCIHTEEPIETMARIVGNLVFSGLPFEDAAVETEKTRYSFKFVDDLKETGPAPFTAMKLLYDPVQDKFYDSSGIYPDLRNSLLVKDGSQVHPVIYLMEAAKLVSRYHYTFKTDFKVTEREAISLKEEHQKDLLVSILLGRFTEKGLNLLHETGFIDYYWPELQSMTSVKQAKDYHPEGNVWKHTLETFQYRKKVNLRLSLGLLLHDIGKPVSTGTTSNPFTNHSEHGVKIAHKFLKRLGFEEQTIQDVLFLVRYHMLPAGLPKLPLYKTETIMNSHVFPILLELYRADMSSSFWGPDKYYEACRFYRNYISKKSRIY
ncbi:MAG: HD domain-containing protein [Spirochaetales bacterium]|nr:HD domain-containing protein [Spirochaetales bacterium]